VVVTIAVIGTTGAVQSTSSDELVWTPESPDGTFLGQHAKGAWKAFAVAFFCSTVVQLFLGIIRGAQ
jgi:hypothetical protein